MYQQDAYINIFSKTCAVLVAKKVQTSGGRIITLTCTGFDRIRLVIYIYINMYVYIYIYTYA